MTHFSSTEEIQLLETGWAVTPALVKHAFQVNVGYLL